MPRPPQPVASVNEVDVRGVVGAAIGQAACASRVMVSSNGVGVRTAMPSIGLQRCWSCHSSLAYRSTARIRRWMEPMSGKMLTTPALRWIPLLRLPSDLVQRKLVRC
jgi:hypothetical protein